MGRYVFFDQLIDLTLPPEWEDQWNALYGACRRESADSPTLYIRATRETEDELTLDIGGQRRRVRPDSILVHLQDHVQNHILPAVQSRLLWHGAAWCIDGGGVMMLGESGVGKTTLSLLEQRGGGQVLSDEVAAYAPDTMELEPFPRAMAVRPDALSLLGAPEQYLRLHIDETKAIVPLASTIQAVPLRTVVVLEWAPDDDTPTDPLLYELNVCAPDRQWQAALSRIADGAACRVHPDAGDWWRCRLNKPVSVPALESAVRTGGGLLRGFHRGARRMPDYSKAPDIRPITTTEAAERILAELLNARQWMRIHGAASLLGPIRAACDQARCVVCVPGRLEETRQAIHAVARSNPFARNSRRQS